MSQKLSEGMQAVSLKAHAAETTSTTGAAVPIGAATERPQRVLAVVDISAVGADADETMGLVIEGRNATTETFVDVIEAGEVAPAATQPTGAQRGLLALKPRNEYRYVSVLAGTTPSFTYGIVLLLQAGRRAGGNQQLA